MTATGVMPHTLKTGTGNAGMLSGTMKSGADGSFERIMETAQKTGTGKTSQSQAKAKRPSRVSDAAGARSRQLWKEKGKAGAAAAAGKKSPSAAETAEAVSTLLVQVQQTVSECLGITPEELSETMDQLGMKAEELLLDDRLKDLFLAQNGVADPAEFLTNEALFNDFSALVQAVEQELSESGMTEDAVRELFSEQGFLEPEEKFVTDREEPLVSDRNAETDASGAGTSERADTGAAVQKKESTSSEKEQSGSQGNLARAEERSGSRVISSQRDPEVKESFLNAMTFVTAQNSEEAVSAAGQLREIARQVMEQIKIVIRPEQTSMELNLNPEQLGRVHLTVTQREGRMTAQFTTQTEIAREALESQMESLKETLQNQGLRIEAIEVSVSEFGFDRDRDANRQNGEAPDRRKQRSTFRMERTDEDAAGTEEYRNMTDRNVDYSA